MRRRILAPSFVLAAGLLALAACDNGPANPSGSTARLSVQLTDAPGDLAEAWVKVQKVQFMGGDTLTPAQDLAVVDTGWIDLLALADRNSVDLFTGTLPAAQYSQVRLVVCDMYVKTTDGQIIATPGAPLPDGVTPAGNTQLKLASECQSGFKINIPHDSLSLDPSTVNTLVIDFDAKRSFSHQNQVQAGNSGMWVVTPVLFGALSVESRPATGSIAGKVSVAQGVSASCGGSTMEADSLLKYFAPTAVVNDTSHSGTMSDSTYTIANLVAGTYTMANDPVGFANGDSLFYTATAAPGTVPVTLGATAASDYSITAATCQAAQ